MNVERLGIDPSIICQHYELSLATGTFSTHKRTRHGLTVRKNKQSANTVINKQKFQKTD